MTNTPTSYPSDALEEAKALRAENEKLRAALKTDPWKVGFAHWKALRARALGDDQ